MHKTEKLESKEIHNWDEVSGFHSEAEEAAFWSNHCLGDEILAEMTPVPEDILPPPRRQKQSLNNVLRYAVVIQKNQGNYSAYVPDLQGCVAVSKTLEEVKQTTQVSTAEALTVTMPMPENVTESYLEIREVETDFAITVIEILSPLNLRAGEGRKIYELKRKQVLASLTHLVEIDLLRGGKPLPILEDIPATDYRIVVSKSDRRPQAQLYGFSVRHQIPTFPLPLQSKHTEPIVDIHTLLNAVYTRARYYLAIDYNQEPLPPLKPEDAVWMNTLLREQGLRI